MENKMAEVAKLLGVELGEDFTLKNSNYIYKVTKFGLVKRSRNDSLFVGSSMLDDLLLGKFTIIKIPKKILDSAEKKYLSAVIKPFRSRVRWIRKYYLSCQEFIQICVYNGNEALDWMTFELPYFKRGTMYQGMQIDKRYTIQELGL